MIKKQRDISPKRISCDKYTCGKTRNIIRTHQLRSCDTVYPHLTSIGRLKWKTAATLA